MHENMVEVTVTGRSGDGGASHCIPAHLSWDQWRAVATVLGLNPNASCNCD